MAGPRQIAAQVPGAKAGGSMVGGPPRVVHHITWDALRKDDTPAITFDGVARYLVEVGYEPHLLIDPITGRTVQFVPLDRSSYALANQAGGVETNRYGTVCIQVEWYFTPGVVRDGKRYASLTDTPLAGLDKLLAAADAWDVPRTWVGGRRDVNTWTKVAGHRGHRDVPENDHTDPPDPLDTARLLAAEEEDDDMPLTPADVKAIGDEIVKRLGADATHPYTGAFIVRRLATLEAQIRAVAAAGSGQPVDLDALAQKVVAELARELAQ